MPFLFVHEGAGGDFHAHSNQVTVKVVQMMGKDAADGRQCETRGVEIGRLGCHLSVGIEIAEQLTEEERLCDPSSVAHNCLKMNDVI